jgi:2-polyprenyl-3-methyl-5-hydroxy-6-metoxy-1,4-benzoquinol methylase
MSDSFNYSSKYYPPEEDHYSKKGKYEEVRIRRIAELVGKNKTVLDIGCYDGTIADKVIKNGNVVYGIDASKSAIRTAKKRGVKGVVGNVEKRFPFKDDTFDVAVAGEIIEHIAGTDFFLDEVWRVLKPGGNLVITTPNVASLGRRLMLLFGETPFLEASFNFSLPKNLAAGHLRFFTKRLLLDFLKHKGFVINSFESDVVNFPFFASRGLSKVFPSFGRVLIVSACKAEKRNP